jgi:hypothetical protein
LGIRHRGRAVCCGLPTPGEYLSAGGDSISWHAQIHQSAAELCVIRCVQCVELQRLRGRLRPGAPA